jgi:hypothetical protein
MHNVMKDCGPMPCVVLRYFAFRRLGWEPYYAWGLAMTRCRVRAPQL